jgi:hypothetical protein
MSEQLELFQVLSKNQLAMIQEYKNRQEKYSISEKLSTDSIQTLMVEAGFILGEDFQNTFKTHKVTKEITLGRYNEPFVTEITYIESTGCVSINYTYYSSQDKLIKHSKAIVSREGKKLECSSITSQYRAYLPSSLLQKLKEKNKKSTNEFEKANLESSMMLHTIAKYEDLYPEACISPSTDFSKYNGRYQSYDTILIEFKSGSTVTLRFGHNIDDEYISKSVDAVVKNMEMTDKLNHFNNQ